jgi:GNAT superfamily N-acetyltransferase
VRALLGLAGFQERGSEVLLTWRDFTPPEPPPPAPACTLELVWNDEARLTVRAVRDGEELGWCAMDKWPVRLSREEDWCFCPGLRVEEPFQGQRLGTSLLTAALQEMRRAGCRHTALSTGWQNHRAVLMYTNLGYRHADRTSNFIKVLDASSDLARALQPGA